MTKPLKEAHHRETLSIAEQAEQWRQILKSAGPAERAAFWAWVKQSSLHLREVLLADAFQEALGRMDPEKKIQVEKLIDKAKSASNVASLGHSRVQPPTGARNARRIWGGSIAASAVLAALFLQLLRPETYETSSGEQRALKLKDGSVVFLNTESRIQTDFSDTGRDIYLTDGQAHFQVEHDATRPFRVHVAAATIQALGTKFDVRRYADRTSVAVMEGVVAVLPDNAASASSDNELPPAKIAAGKGATIDLSGTINTSTIDPQEATAWTRQQLVFRDATLEFIAGEFNRYNTKLSLHVAADARDRRFNGVFNMYSPDSFLRVVADELDLEYEKRGREVTIRARSIKAQH